MEIDRVRARKRVRNRKSERIGVSLYLDEVWTQRHPNAVHVLLQIYYIILYHVIIQCHNVECQEA